MNNNFIHPTAIIGGDVQLGKNNYIGPFCILNGPIKMGNNNRLEAFVSVGMPPQDDKFTPEEVDSFIRGISPLSHEQSRIQIGDNNTFREFVTIHKPEISVTKIGSFCYLMTQSHVSHDTVLHDRVKLANNVHLGGFSRILDDAYLGLSTSVLQFSLIGSKVMVGMNSTVNKHVHPFLTVVGTPARKIGINLKKLPKFESNTWLENYPQESNEIPGEVKQELLVFEKYRQKMVEVKNRYNSLIIHAQINESK